MDEASKRIQAVAHGIGQQIIEMIVACNPKTLPATEEIMTQLVVQLILKEPTLMRYVVVALRQEDVLAHFPFGDFLESR